MTEVFGDLRNKFAHDEWIVGLAQDLLAHRYGRFADKVCHAFASPLRIKRVCTVWRISRPMIHRQRALARKTACKTMRLCMQTRFSTCAQQKFHLPPCEDHFPSFVGVGSPARDVTTLSRIADVRSEY